MRKTGKILSELENSIKEVLQLHQKKAIEAADDGSIESVLHPTHTKEIDDWLKYEVVKLRTAAITLWQQQPQLPEPPKPEADPIAELQNIRQWYIKNETSITASGKAGDTNKPKKKVEPLSEKDNAVKMKSCWYSEDFTTVIWFGKEYRFNKTQSLCIQYLWQNVTASEKTIGEHINSAADNYRLITTFRSKKGKHPAWGKMIVSSGKGIFALKKTTKK